MKEEKRSEKAVRRTSISDETFNYYKRVHESFKDLTGIDQDIFFTNVFRQLENEALVVCQHKIFSFNIELMLKSAQPKHLCMLWRAFTPSWIMACTDAYASHVFHSLILRFPVTFDIDANTLTVNQEDNDDMEESGKEMKKNNTDTEQLKDGDQMTSTRKMFLEFCSFLKEKFEELITNTYATHIVRAALQVLGNVSVANNITIVQSNKKSDSYKEKLHVSKSDETFHREFFKISKLIVNSSHFTHYVSDRAANPVMQLILHITYQLKQQKGDKLSKKLIRLCGFFDVPAVDPETPLTDDTRLPVLMMDGYGTYLVQLLLQHCSEKLLLAWYESSFKDRLIAYAVHEQSNYVLQQVIDRCPSKEMFTSIFDEITPYLEDILSMGHMGLVKSLIQKCLTLGTKQKKIVKKLLDAFHCTEEDKKILIVPLLMVMKSYEVYIENITIDHELENPEKFASIIINIHGSMIMQTLFNFGNPKLFVDSFLHLTPKQMVSVICSYYGNFMIKEYFKSSTIGEKSKDALLEKISGSYSDIACNRIGSHSWQDIWNYLSINQKTIIAEEMCKQIEKIKKNKYGLYVYSNFSLGTYHHNCQQWQTSQAALTNKRKMFKAILDPNEVRKKSKKKKSSESKENKQDCLNSTDGPDDAIDLNLFKPKNKVKT